MRFSGIMQYDGDLKLPKNFIVPPPVIDKVSGQYLTGSGIRTFAISETQKFGHVTFFWNGNRSGFFSADLETFIEVGSALCSACFLYEELQGRGQELANMATCPACLECPLLSDSEAGWMLQIPSDKVVFNEKPEMKAREICDAAKEAILSGAFDMVRVNFANPDMVGHTGDLKATTYVRSPSPLALHQHALPPLACSGIQTDLFMRTLPVQVGLPLEKAGVEALWSL
jgi:2,3-bisphosphoglycerate-independent phosphoglycerate mutase